MTSKPRQSERVNHDLRGLCSARLQAGTLESSTCPPEGGRYTNQNRVLTHLRRGRHMRSDNKHACQFAAAPPPHPIARMEPPPRRKLYMLGNWSDNPK